MKLTRRNLLKMSLLACSAPILGLEKITWPGPSKPSPATGETPASGKNLGAIDFQSDVWLTMDTPVGNELDGRLYTDLSQISAENPVVPTEKFYLRTRASAFLEDQQPWQVKIGGLEKQPVSLTVDQLVAMTKPMGRHLLECSGNYSTAHFGLMGVAEWSGVLLTDVLDRIKLEPQARRIMVSGFDRYLRRSRSSVPGASWVFTLEQLSSCKAFLATMMNGQPLTPDHGAPVRLIAPGWYGCTCIKWVNEITLVSDDVEATSQMQEFAARTLQPGMPKLARDYSPATIDQAAMPIRIEKWLIGGKVKYRVHGILWGGSRPVKILEIQFNPSDPFVPVDNFRQPENDPWSFWTHLWTPAKTGTYRFQLRVKEPVVRARKMDAGFYARSVEIREI